MKHLSIFIITIGFSLCAFGQNNLGKTDDLGRISLMAIVPQQVEGLPSSAHNLLYNKLQQIATKNGLAGGYNDRFVITANIVVLTKDLTSTAPPMHAYNLQVTLYIADYVDKTVFTSVTKDLKGVGTNENKAYIQALKNINPADPVIRKFVETGKEKIIELYNSRCDFFIDKAEALASQKKYEEAIYQLVSIPEVCKECYSKAMEKVEPMYKDFADMQCEQLLIKAKAEWAGSQNTEGARNAGRYLSNVDPDAKCMADVETFIVQIKSKIKADEDRDWDFQVKQWDDQVSIEKQKVDARKQVGMAYANSLASRYGYYHGNFVNWIFE